MVQHLSIEEVILQDEPSFGHASSIEVVAQERELFTGCHLGGARVAFFRPQRRK
jgi:hypothetical protein